MSRIGTGYDVHRLTEGRKLIIGGVEIPYEKGLLGHSDADVLLHAIMDALLGAAAAGDIGLHFPDNDPAYEGASSLMLLRKVGGILTNKGYYINNIDDAREYRDGPRDSGGPGQCQGDDGGASRLHGTGRGNLRAGGLQH